eukprot:CAMPEP_0196587400 /NCGR_PEP_ID=MMETSP1081-20130531/57361_1 /TAXON_ID=36882 /ORGANISM="Pyramimonas amylifera, Strain CCMP720" /LENGTH=255 /DNA_ID=CAMNT_0041909581 /DNA_START=140 /DNA_END=904 /DNA_ORIENTATION=+
MEIPVKLKVNIDARVASAIVTEVVKYLLYFQNQSPGPVDQVMQEVKEAADESRCEKVAESLPSHPANHPPPQPLQQPQTAPPCKRRRMKTADRKLCKFVRSVEGVFEFLQPDFLAQIQATDILLILGASAVRPKMACQLHFQSDSSSGFKPSSSEDLSEVGKSKASRQTLDCARQAVRALIVSASEAPVVSGATKMFLLFRAPVSESLPLTFLPKRGYTTQWRRGRAQIKPFLLNFDNASSNGDSEMVESSNFIW